MFHKANLKHAKYDLGLPNQCSDEELYQNAIKDERFVLTINFDDFRNLVKSGKPGIFAIPPYLTNNQIDSMVCKFISGKDPKDFIGKATKIPA